MTDPSSPYPEVPAEPDALSARIRAEVASLSLQGHDRDCALAMLSQADSRYSSRLDAIQVAHLLAIGRRAGVAAGRAQAAADIRAHMGPDPSPASPTWWAGYTEALSDCARIAAGGAEGDPSKDPSKIVPAEPEEV